MEPQEGLRLRFWARFDSIEAGDWAFVQVTADGVNLIVYSLFSEEKNDNTWHFYDIDVSLPPVSEPLRVTFQTEMDPEDDLWHIDDVELAAPAP